MLLGQWLITYSNYNNSEGLLQLIYVVTCDINYFANKDTNEIAQNANKLGFGGKNFHLTKF